MRTGCDAGWFRFPSGALGREVRVVYPTSKESLWRSSVRRWGVSGGKTYGSS